MPFSRAIEALIPEARAAFWAFDAGMKAAGLHFLVTCTYRDSASQQALFAQGRRPLPEVNRLRKLAGLPPLTEEENRRRVTWTLISAHTQRIAWDIVIIDPSKPRKDHAQWSLKVDVDRDHIPDYEEAAQVGRRLGLTVGADFPNPDYPHFQYRIVT